METTSPHEPKKKVQISAKLKEIDILVTECSTPNISSPLPPKTSQFLLPEDQNNLDQITIVQPQKASKVTEPLIEPLEEVYSVAFHRKAAAENSRFSRRRSTLMTFLDSHESSSRRNSKISILRRFSYPKTNHTGQPTHEEKELLEATTEKVKATRKASFSPAPLVVISTGQEPSETSEVRRSSSSQDSRRMTLPSLRRDSTADNNRQEQKLARISILIVWLFLFCHIWKLFPTAYEAGYSTDGLKHKDWPFWVLLVEYLSHLLITLNSTINFLIYAIM